MPVCAFCGESFRGRTKDHVPPRGLFENNPKFQLLTVPACLKCNNNASKDDEYFRILAFDYRAAELASVRDARDSTTRALFKEEKQGFRAYDHG